MAELVPSHGIFCLQPWLLQPFEHISPRKTPVYMSIELRSINSCSSIKMKCKLDDIAEVVQWLEEQFFFVIIIKMNKFQQ